MSPSFVAQVELPSQFPASVERERAASDPVLHVRVLGVIPQVLLQE